MSTWEKQLKPILIKKIEEAVNHQGDGNALFPWLGHNVYEIMAEAAICVLRGMQDAQEFMKDEGMLREI